MEIPYWLGQTLAASPFAFWIYIGLGVPWALVVLPRADWQNRVLVLCLAFAFGPGLLTAWMLIPGTIGGALEKPFLRFDLLIAGTFFLALCGVILAWRKANRTQSLVLARASITYDEWVLIGLIVAAVVIRWFVTAYWPFTAYDALWVFGYEGRRWFLDGFISQEIGYYPQFVPLQYTFLQLAVGSIDDHAARAVIPFMHVGSILATYSLGSQLVNRRTGLFAAAIWTLYPHVGIWAHIGDLEIPLAFLFTATCTFFLLAWKAQDSFLRRRYAMIAGLVYGIALWTKPTAGAFVWGVLLVIMVEMIRHRLQWRLWLPRFEVAIMTGVFAFPLGTVWYLRNIALGLPAIVFPHESWLDSATRSGDLLSWPILGLLVTSFHLTFGNPRMRGKWLVGIGVIMILAGIMPSSPLVIRANTALFFGLFDPARIDPPASRLVLHEWLAIIAGLVLVAIWFRSRISLISREFWHILTIVGWAFLLALPYFITWFWSYSYHARLSFPIVPLLILPTAAGLAHISITSQISSLTGFKRTGFACLLLLAAIPGSLVPIFGIDLTSDWLWTDRYKNDYEKYILRNPGVYLTAEQLWGYQEETGISPVVVAPGEQRLHFFLPEAEIVTDTAPTKLVELQGATHFVYGTHARWFYDDKGIEPLTNQIVAALAREDLFLRKLNFTDGTFSYELYQIDPDQRFATAENTRVGHLIEDDVIFGDFVRYKGDNVSNAQLIGNRIFIDYLWEVLATPEQDYNVQIGLLSEQDNQVYAVWEAPVAPHHNGLYYSTRVWEPGERIVDRRVIVLEDARNIPRGRDVYRLVVNFVDRETGGAAPVSINGQSVNGGYPMVARFSVGS